MFDKKQYFKNTAVNYFAFFVNILVTFLLTPFVITSLGDQFYGYWTLIVAFTGYYGFLDFGVRAGVGQYVTRYLASHDFGRFNRVVGTSLFVLSGIGLVGVLISAAIAFGFSHVIFNVSGNVSSFKIALFLVGLSISFKFPAVVFQVVLNGIHRYDITGYVAILSKFINAVLVYFVLSGGYGVLGLAMVTLISQVLEAILMAVLSKIKVPELNISFCFNKATFREVAGYGVFSFIANISDQISFYIGPLLIGKQLGPIAVTYYAVAANLMPYLVSLVQSVSAPLMQIATSFDAQDKSNELQRLLIFGSRYVFWMVGLVCLNVYVSGGAFLGRWIGDKYLTGVTFPSSGNVMRILILGYMIYLSQSVGRQVLFGMRKNRKLALFGLFTAVSVSSLTWILIPKYSIYGACIAIVISIFVAYGIFMPIYTSKVAGVTYLGFIRQSFAPVIVVFAVAMFFVFEYVAEPDFQWGSILLTCSKTTAIYLVVSVPLYFKEFRKILQFRANPQAG